MKRSVFSEYVFDWDRENLFPLHDRLPYVPQLDSALTRLSYRREPYSMYPATSYRPFAMYLRVEGSQPISEPELERFGQALAREIRHHRFQMETPRIKWQAPKGEERFGTETEVEVVIKLPSGLEEGRAVMKLTELLCKACPFEPEVLICVPQETHEPYVRVDGEWVTRSSYLMRRHFKDSFQGEAVTADRVLVM